MIKVRREEIIGRKEEKRVLQRIFDSKTSEFLAIYGRRRVGKTYLIKQFFYTKECYFFQITGVKKAPLKEQLYEFTRQVEKTFYPPGTTLKEPRGWMRAVRKNMVKCRHYVFHIRFLIDHQRLELCQWFLESGR